MKTIFKFLCGQNRPVLHSAQSFQKACKVIEICKTDEHFATASAYILQFDKMFNEPKLLEYLE